MTTVTLDGLLRDVGACGLFQGLLVLAVQATLGCCVWGMMLMAYGGYDPGWVCLDEDVAPLARNQSALPSRTGSDGRLGLDVHVTTAESPSVVSNATDRCVEFSRCRNVSFLPGSSTVVSEWALVCDRKWVPSLIFTVQMCGVLVGAYLSGHLGDRIGRKASLYGAVGLHALVNLVAVFSPSWQVFAAVRFFIGIAFGGIITTTSTFGIEFLGQFWRGVVGAIPTWNISAGLFSIAVLLLRDWRQLHLLTAAISGAVFLPVFWIPESLRWLAVHGRDARAGHVVGKIARTNSRPVPSSELLAGMAESERRRAAQENSGRYSYIHLFRDATLRKSSVIMGILWVSMAFVYFGISFGIQALSGDFYINFLIFSVMEIPGNIFVVPALSFLGRRWGAAVHYLIVSLACFAVVPVTLLLGADGDADSGEDVVKGKVVMGLALVAKVGVIGGWAIATVFCGELFPTVVRNLGFGYANAAARLGGMLGPVLFPRDPAFLHIALAGIGALMLVCVGLVLALPETKGAPLQDTLRTYSGSPVEEKHAHEGFLNAHANSDLNNVKDDNCAQVSLKVIA